MQVICSCGKKLFFGDDPNEEQICDRCGQTASASGTAVPKRQAPRRGAPGGRGAAPGEEEPAPRRVQPPPQISERKKLFVASDRRSRKGLGCLFLLLLVVGAAFAADWFLRPSAGLPCGHAGKESYLFGVLPLGHSCEGLTALRYLDRARRGGLGARPPRDFTSFEEVKDLPGVGGPPEGTPYRFSLLDDGSFAADPSGPDSDLYHYLMGPDGTVRYEKGAEATPESPESGAFGRPKAGAQPSGE